MLRGEQNRGFHSAMYQGCHNSALAEHATNLRLRIAPFRRAQFRSEQRPRQFHKEHAAILSQVPGKSGEWVTL